MLQKRQKNHDKSGENVSWGCDWGVCCTAGAKMKKGEIERKGTSQGKLLKKGRPVEKKPDP